jgi:hypothetical protein
MRSLLLLFALAGTAAAQGTPAQPAVSTYALVVGSNAAGPGQTELRYAEDDARRVGAILKELGGYTAGSVDIVVHPTPDVLRQRLDQLAARVKADTAAGRQVRVFFYYSGHARATAIDLGPSALPLAELRQRLFSVPAALTVVVLDACQSGAFSRVKGATPAADFSFNSRQQLGATGTAVLASSSDSELSQESEQLRSSYFTHHLLVGMRGAGDNNNDGAVSIDEAYRYAYHQTLIATAATAVGGQHVSLEVDLKGHGEVPLSFPRAATKSITLPASLEGQTLVQDKRAKAVVAETYKAKGKAVRIAVAPGDYEVLVRHDGRLRRCQLSAGGEVDLARCTNEKIVAASSKGGGFERPYRVSLTATVGGERGDSYTRTLEDFGFQEQLFSAAGGLDGVVTRQVHPYIHVGGSLGYMDSPRYERSTDLTPLRFEWGTTRLLAIAQGELAAGDDGFLKRVVLYARAGAGVAMSRTRFDDQDNMTTRETYFGPALSGAVGVRLENLFVTGLGIAAGYELQYHPTIENLAGETHAGGGHRLSLGLSYSFGGSR